MENIDHYLEEAKQEKKTMEKTHEEGIQKLQEAMAQASERQRVAELARIDAAVQRIDAGTYGDCLSCGEEIAPGRLEADPAASLCIACAT